MAICLAPSVECDALQSFMYQLQKNMRRNLWTSYDIPNIAIKQKYAFPHTPNIDIYFTVKTGRNGCVAAAAGGRGAPFQERQRKYGAGERR